MEPQTTHILVVDDDPAVCRALEARLGQAGYRVSSVMYGEHALRYCVNDPPEILLLDVNLPDMDGFEVCEKVRTLVDSPGMAVLFLTGEPACGPRGRLSRKVLQSGGDYFVAKPYDGNLVVSLIDEIVYENRTNIERV